MAPSSRLNELLTKASAALEQDCSQRAKDALKAKLKDLASEMFLEWVVAEKRFDSQSQQTEYWLSRFYEEIYQDEQPDPTKIYARFNLSLPRSSYVTRLLRARRMPQWRKAAQTELKTQLSRLRKKADQAVKDGQGQIQEFDVSLSSGAADELRVVYDRISGSIEEKERPRPPKIKPVFGSARWFSLPADTLILILDSL